ncbi:hypothetical protein [Candidatus Albibeggiatoa sp. nov. BB20]|uniref:hypothetical protein n=1 Tax=Candidatus Albibeggiatoa sp. nov. BB20 TaxID=3162723 RepID=UPI003365311B
MTLFRQYIKQVVVCFSLLSIFSLNLEARELREVPDNIIQCDTACIQIAYPYALISQDVYDDNASFDKQGWTRGQGLIVFDFQNTDLFFDDETWLIQGDDGLHMGLYINADRHEAVLAVRGTEFNSLDDLLADIQQLFGAIPEQYENALSATEELLPYIQQTGYSLAIAGHSLGGGIAQYIANSFNLPAITFNSAPISEEVENDSFARKYPEGYTGEYPTPFIYNLVFRKEGGWWSSYDIIADSYSSANSGGLLGTSFSLITEEGVDLLELHSLDEMIEEMQRRTTQ